MTSISNSDINVYTTTQAAEKLGVTVGRVHQLITQGRVKGAHKIGMGRGTWVIQAGESGKIEVAPGARKFAKI